MQSLKVLKNKHNLIVGILTILIFPLFFIFGQLITQIYLAIVGILLYLYLPTEKKALIIFIFLVGVIIPVLSDVKKLLSPKSYLVVYTNRNYIVNATSLGSVNANELYTINNPVTNTQNLYFYKYITESKKRKSFRSFAYPVDPSKHAAVYSILIKNEGTADLNEDVWILGEIDAEKIEIKDQDARIFLNDATGGFFGKKNILFHIRNLEKGKTASFVIFSNKVGDIKMKCQNYKNCDYALNEVLIHKIGNFPFKIKSDGKNISVPDVRNPNGIIWLGYKDGEWKDVRDVFPGLGFGARPIYEDSQ